MINFPGQISGIRIYESVHAVRKTDIPNNIHVKTRSMSDSYHHRVQKKWIKRWGYYMEPCAYQIQNGLVCHPAIRREIEVMMNNG